MRKIFLAAVGVALLIGGSVAFARTAPVEITKSGFSAHDVAVQSGDAVSWKNSDTAAHAGRGRQDQLQAQPAAGAERVVHVRDGRHVHVQRSDHEGQRAEGSPFAGTLAVAQNTRAVSHRQRPAR